MIQKISKRVRFATYHRVQGSTILLLSVFADSCESGESRIPIGFLRVVAGSSHC